MRSHCERKFRNRGPTFREFRCGIDRSGGANEILDSSNPRQRLNDSDGASLRQVFFDMGHYRAVTAVPRFGR